MEEAKLKLRFDRRVRQDNSSRQHPRWGNRGVRLDLPTALLLLATACADGGEPVVHVATGIRDSAGITISENAGPEWGGQTPWTVAADPEVTIGTVGGAEEYQLNEVQNAVRLGNGTIAVADGGSNRVRIYDRTGSHLRDIGGGGDGPAEFRMLGSVGRIRGDSIAAWDARSRRITIFDPRGDFSGVTVVRDVPGLVVADHGWFADGSVLITPGLSVAGTRNALPGDRREPVTWMRATRDGTADTLTVLPGREEVVSRHGNTVSIGPVLYGNDSHVFAAENALYGGPSDLPEVQVWSADGRLQRIVRWAAKPRAVSTADRKWVREQARARQERRRALLAQIGGPADQSEEAEPASRDTHPYFDRIVVDTEGELWVRTWAGYGGVQEWLVFDRNGVLQGVVSTPASLEITDIGGDYILGLSRDELDVQQVRLYRIRGREARK